MVDVNKLRITRQAQQVMGGSYRCAIYGNTYAKSLPYAAYLAALAHQDYPDLDGDDIEIVIYAGDSIRYHLGIEFNVLELANGYAVTELEPTLA